jgi:uncharacterized protein (DUF736 family)
MAFDDSNSGALFKNDKKGNDRAPDYRGELKVAGELHEIAAWLKVSKAGTKYMSLSVKPKEEQAPKPKPATGGGIDDMDSDIPF